MKWDEGLDAFVIDIQKVKVFSINDNAHNMRKVGALVPTIPCFGHTLQLAGCGLTLLEILKNLAEI